MSLLLHNPISNAPDPICMYFTFINLISNDASLGLPSASQTWREKIASPSPAPLILARTYDNRYCGCITGHHESAPFSPDGFLYSLRLTYTKSKSYLYLFERRDEQDFQRSDRKEERACRCC